MRINRHLVGIAAAVGLLCGPAVAVSTAAAATAPAPDTHAAVSAAPAATAVPRPDHVVIVMFENTSETSIVGNSKAPYFNQLADSGANFTQSYAIQHPSQPNYLDLFSGSNQGVNDDSCPHTFSTDNEAAQLIAKGLTFSGYSEDLPSTGSTVCTSGNYARKHVPWANFSNVPSADNKPFSSFPSDYTQLPTVSWVIPNLCDDMHNCSIATGDTWLKNNLDGYVQWAKTHNSLLITTFDEDDSTTSANRIATFFNGQPVQAGSYSEHIDHYSVLRTVEDMYGLPYAGAAAQATTISDVWNTGGTGGGSCTAAQLLGNPGFESGNTAWSASSGVIGQYGSQGEPAHSGSWDAWMDGYGSSHTDTVAQSVALPPSCTSAVFVFYLHIDTAETTTSTAYDKLTVKAGSTTLATFSNLDAASGYAKESVDLSTYAGQTVTLTFTGTEDSSQQTSFVVDDTAVDVG